MATLRSGLLKEVWCNEDMLSAVEEVLWHRSRGITSCGRKEAFQELSGLQGWDFIEPESVFL